ncbi:MAG: hypothetical protein Q9165_002136 [Trypethelium subeluteriae]
MDKTDDFSDLLSDALSIALLKEHDARQRAKADGSAEIEESKNREYHRRHSEAMALEHVSRMLRTPTLGLNVGLPTYHRDNPDTSKLVVSCRDEPTLNLNNVEMMYQNTPSSRIREIGIRLGRWLTHLHRSTRYVDIGPYGNMVAKIAVCNRYAKVTTALKFFSLAGSIGERIVEPYKDLKTDDDCVCMGHFSPQRVVVADGRGLLPILNPGTEGEYDRGQGPEDLDPYFDDEIADLTPRLTVVNWGDVRRGSGATDVGQFAAEAWVIDRFKVGLRQHYGLANAFLKAYLHAAQPNFQFRMKLAVHTGVQLCVWSHAEVLEGRSNYVEMKDVAGLGEAIIKKALEGDSSWIDLFLKA